MHNCDYENENQHIKIDTWNYSNDILYMLAGRYDEVGWELPLKDFVCDFVDEFSLDSEGKRLVYAALEYLSARKIITMKEVE